MQQQQSKRPTVAQLYPPEFRDALVSAGQRRDTDMSDLLTDQLATRGFCRPRNADSQPQRPGWYQ